MNILAAITRGLRRSSSSSAFRLIIGTRAPKGQVSAIVVSSGGRYDLFRRLSQA